MLAVMSNLATFAYLAAATASVATLTAHLVLGGHLFARPLLRSALPSPVKHTVYFCWHLVSATLAVMTASFVWAALQPHAWPAAISGLALAVAFLGVNVVQNLTMRLSFALHPQGGFFLVVALLGAAGLAYGPA
jgi:hypothetical protein